MKPNDSNIWFFIKDHQQQGPVCLFELRKLIEQRVLTPDTYVWNSSMACWQMAKTLEIFSDSIFESTRIHLLPDKFKTNKEIEFATYPQGRPYVRYLARFFDLSIFSIILITFFSIFSPQFLSQTSNLFVFIISLVLWILVEPFIIALFGNTLGKAFLNTKIKSVNGEKISYFTALKRSMFVSAAGMGFGIPFINFFCFLFSYRDLKGHGVSTWDKQFGTIILYGNVSMKRVIIAASFPFLLLIAGFYI